MKEIAKNEIKDKEIYKPSTPPPVKSCKTFPLYPSLTLRVIYNADERLGGVHNPRKLESFVFLKLESCNLVNTSKI